MALFDWQAGIRVLRALVDNPCPPQAAIDLMNQIIGRCVDSVSEGVDLASEGLSGLGGEVGLLPGIEYEDPDEEKPVEDREIPLPNNAKDVLIIALQAEIVRLKAELAICEDRCPPPPEDYNFGGGGATRPY